MALEKKNSGSFLIFFNLEKMITIKPVKKLALKMRS